MVIRDIPFNEKPTIVVVDGGASPSTKANSFGSLGLLFTILSCKEKNVFKFLSLHFFF
jgi:hypothetical protein